MAEITKRIIEPGEEALTAEDHVAILGQAVKAALMQMAQKINGLILAHNTMAAEIQHLKELLEPERKN